MKILNNKGQSLVLFILLIPIIIGVMALVFDLGNALIKKNNLDSSIELSIESSIKNNIQEDKSLTSININNMLLDIEVLLTYNLDDINTNIYLKDEIIIVEASTYVEGVFTNILNIEGFKIESKYLVNSASLDIEKIK